MGSRFRDLARIQGAMLWVLAISMIIPFTIALVLGETSSCKAFGYIIVTCGLIGLLPRILFKPSQRTFKYRDGFLVVSLAWLISSFVGALPLYLSGAVPSLIDSFFEACSGFSTTGASILPDIEALPRSVLFWRSFTHWLGGMGIVVFVTAFLPFLGINGQIAANAETPGPTKDKVTAKFSDTARGLYKIYIYFTIAEVVLLMLCGLSLYDALVHTFGTVGTGGFSTYNDSIAHFTNPMVHVVIIVFMFLAGMNFNLFYLARRAGLGIVLKDEEFRYYALIVLSASVLVFICNSFYNGFEDMGTLLLNGVFQVVSILTTTGYGTNDYTLWPTFSQAIILCLFFIGGCSSSTAGGIKCVRSLVSFKLIRRSFSLKIHPHRIAHFSLNHREVSSDVVIKIIYFIFAYVFTLLAGTVLISINNFDFMTSFTAAATCIGNIGPGFGSIGPSFNFALFSPFTKLVCSFLMIAGRLELFTLIVLFSRYYWNSNRTR